MESGFDFLVCNYGVHVLNTACVYNFKVPLACVMWAHEDIHYSSRLALLRMNIQEKDKGLDLLYNSGGLNS